MLSRSTFPPTTAISIPAAPKFGLILRQIKSERLPYVVIVAIFLLAGLIGHDPWKADEAYVFGMIQHLLDTGDWVVPMVAGEPFMEKPPLYYWVAAFFAKCFSGILPIHDGARLASGFFMIVTCCALRSTVRVWWGRGIGRYAAFVLVASLGVLVQTHTMMPDLPLLSGFAMSALGFSYVLSRPVKGGIFLGLGIGIGFMSKGVLAPAVIGVTALILPVLFSEWRAASYRRGLMIALGVASPWLLIWPIALYHRSYELFMDWFWMNNIGRFVGFSVPILKTEHLPWFWSQTIPWYTFPALPLAMFALWQKRNTALREPAMQYSIVSFAALMLVLAVSSSGRCIYALPLMIPLAIVASAATTKLPKRIDDVWVWSSIILFGALSLLIWGGWAIMMATGTPPAWPFLLRYLPASFVPEFDADDFFIAALITIGALFALRKLWHAPARGLMTWVIGITLAWSLLMTIWLPWLDFSKSYRDVFSAMPLPKQMKCVATIGLGEGERAMLRYVTGHFPIRREINKHADCDVLLVQGFLKEGVENVDLKGWKHVWEGARPGDTSERFWLYIAAH